MFSATKSEEKRMFSQAKDYRAKKLVKVFACRIRIPEKKMYIMDIVLYQSG